MNNETVKIWAYSLNSCCEIVESLELMSKKETPDNNKEEMKSRIIKEEVDRNILHKKLKFSIDTLDPTQHPKDGFVNIVTGKVVTDPAVNVHQSLELGKTHGNSAKRILRYN